MKTLLILRHAKSSWKDGKLHDHDRPLNKRGKRDAPRMGELLDQEDLVPDLIISSTAKRARKTAKAVAKACDYDGEVRLERNLYHGVPENYIYILRRLPKHYECVMVVGHNPSLEYLLEELTGNDEKMPTAALAQVTFKIKKWKQLNEDTEGKLVKLWRPREL